MKIALISAWYWPAFGGTESAVGTLAELLAERGHDVIVHTRQLGRDIGQDAAPNGIRVRRYRELLSGGFLPHEARDADVVHVHGSDRALLAICSNSFKNAIATLHNGLGRVPDEYIGQRYVGAKIVFDRWLAKRCLSKYRQVVCLHAEEYSRMKQLCGTAYNLKVIPNTIAPDLVAYRDTHSKTTGGYFLAIGRLSPEKGMDRLIRAAAAGGFKLVIAGDGPAPYRLYLEALAESAGADVMFAGYVNGPVKYKMIAEARALLVGSPYEGLSIAILEAMALGVPVIASPPASRGLIEHGITGLHFECSSQESLLEAVMLASRGGDQISQITARALNEFNEQFHPRVVVDQLEALYEMVA